MASGIRSVFRFLLSLAICVLCDSAIAGPKRFQKIVASPGYPVIAISETNAGAAIKITGRSFVTASNDVWSGNPVTRPNQSRVIRITGYTSPILTFTGISTLVGDGYFAVIVDGALFAGPQIAQDYLPHEVTVTGISAGSHTIEIWEGPQAAETLNTGTDPIVAGTYVQSVLLRSGTLAKPTAANGIVVTGESQDLGTATLPWQWHGWAGQLRAHAEAAGWLLGYVAYGSRTVAGNGMTPAQFAQCIHDVWTAMGSTTKYLLVYQRSNDFDYWNLSGFTTTPAQLATYWASTLDDLEASDPGYTVNFISSFPSAPNDNSPSGIWFKTDYDTAQAGLSSGRPWVTMRDGSTVFGLVLGPTDYTDSVHFAGTAAPPTPSGGHAKVASVVYGWYGL